MVERTDMEKLLRERAETLTFTKKGIEHRKDGKIVLYYGVIPSENVVEVVRCKDCKYYHPRKSAYYDGYCDNWDSTMIGADGFCSEAERKEDG